MFRRLACSFAILVLGNLWGVQVMAHSLTLTECIEGGEFIRNAALARDNGISREFFVNKLVEDLIVIQSFPPHLRWFAQDSGDERLLSDAVFKVFDEPMKAEEHEASFINTCMQTSASADGKKI